MSLSVAHATTRYRPALGGVEHYIEALADRSVKAGHDVRIHSTNFLTWGRGVRPQPLPAVVPGFEEGPPRVFRHPTVPLGGGRYAISPSMTAALLREDADIFHAHYYGHAPADLAALSARIRRRPLVVNAYMAFEDLRSPLARLHARGPGALLRHSDRIITISAAEEQGLLRLGCDRKRFVRVSPGVDPQEFNQEFSRPEFFSSDGPVLLFVGRLAEAKGLETLAHAMPGILSAHPQAQFVLAGPDFGMTERLQAQLDAVGSSAAVHITGSLSRPGLLACYRHADLLLFPSRAEAFGIVLLEAMAAGLVPLAADAMSIPEVVGNAGVLFPVGNAEALARETIKLLGDADRRRELSEAGRARARMFDWDRSAAVLHSVYDDLARPRRTTRPVLAFGFSGNPGTGGEILYRQLLDGAAARGLLLTEIPGESIPPRARGHAAAPWWAFRRLAAHPGALLFVDATWSTRLFAFLPLLRTFFRQRILVGVCHRPSSGETPGWRRRLMEIAEGFFLRWAHRVLTISRASAREVRAAGVPEERISVLTPTLPSRGRRAGRVGQDETYRILAIGGVTARKGICDLVRALAYLRLEWTLDVVGSLDGDPAEVARVSRLVQSLELGPRVRLHGRVNEAGKLSLLQSADLLVHPSHWEGFGYAVAEAMQFGVPVVAADAGAIPELIQDGVTGLLVPPGSPEDMARAISRLAHDPPLARRLADAAAEAIAGHTDQSGMIDEFVALLTDRPDRRLSLRALQGGRPAGKRTIVAVGWEPWQSPPQCSLAELLTVVARDSTVVWVNPQPEWGEVSPRDYARRLAARTRIRRAPEDVLVVDPPPLPPVGYRFLPHPLRAGWMTVMIGFAKRALAGWLRRALHPRGLRPDIVVLTDPFDLAMAGRLGEKQTAYYVFDETSLFPGLDHQREAMERSEAAGLKHVSVVFTSSLSQMEKRRGRHPRLVPLLNGISIGRFEPPGPIPVDLQELPRPRLLVAGQIDFRLDAALLSGLASSHSDWSIVLLGPLRPSGESAFQRLRTFPNVYWLGHRDPSELAAYQAGCDVGLIPFLLNPATRAMRPLRVLTYLASGLPVVSVPLPELAPFAEHVRTAVGSEEFAEAVAAALVSNDPSAANARRRTALAESWESRADLFRSSLEMNAENDRGPLARCEPDKIRCTA